MTLRFRDPVVHFDLPSTQAAGKAQPLWDSKLNLSVCSLVEHDNDDLKSKEGEVVVSLFRSLLCGDFLFPSFVGSYGILLPVLRLRVC